MDHHERDSFSLECAHCTVLHSTESREDLNVLTIRLASGVKTSQEAPHGTVSILTLYWSTSRPAKVYAHISSGPRSLNVSRDSGWTNHVDLKIIQFHQNTTTQVQEAEIFDDHDVLRQGGGDGCAPPGEDDIYGPGPRIESIHSDDAQLRNPCQVATRTQILTMSPSGSSGLIRYKLTSIPWSRSSWSQRTIGNLKHGWGRSLWHLARPLRGLIGLTR